MSFVLLGILNAQAAGGAAGAGSYDLLETSISSGQADFIDLTNLNTNYGSTYRHLQLRITAVTTSSGTNYIRFNGDTGGNYSVHQYYSTSGSRVANGAANFSSIYTGLTLGSSYKNPMIIDIYNPFDTNLYTSVFTHGSTSESVFMRTGNWMNTTAVSSIRLDPDGNWRENTRISLYGWKAA